MDRILSSNIDGPSDFTLNMEQYMRGTAMPKSTRSRGSSLSSLNSSRLDETALSVDEPEQTTPSRKSNSVNAEPLRAQSPPPGLSSPLKAAGQSPKGIESRRCSVASDASFTHDRVQDHASTTLGGRVTPTPDRKDAEKDAEHDRLRTQLSECRESELKAVALAQSLQAQMQQMKKDRDEEATLLRTVVQSKDDHLQLLKATGSSKETEITQLSEQLKQANIDTEQANLRARTAEDRGAELEEEVLGLRRLETEAVRSQDDGVAAAQQERQAALEESRLLRRAVEVEAEGHSRTRSKMQDQARAHETALAAAKAESQAAEQTASQEAAALRAALESARAQLAAAEAETRTIKQTASEQAAEFRAALQSAQSRLAAARAESEANTRTAAEDATALRAALHSAQSQLATASKETALLHSLHAEVNAALDAKIAAAMRTQEAHWRGRLEGWMAGALDRPEGIGLLRRCRRSLRPSLRTHGL
ncbi:hypothetical protein B0A49_11038 [Cryomyces minteri]|uniref:Uncharacterized protein n=1 Tax=Cryomyces minteri TaxID=331657 RepID=A0A4U0WJX7_9PEZI|nr:hypothetical protein B0A49_11038 [Cryomyces minteri]